MPNRKQNRLIFGTAIQLGIAGRCGRGRIDLGQQRQRGASSPARAAFPVVATPPQAWELTVIDREGKWIKVQDGTQQGYVFENSVSAKQVSGDNNLLANVCADSDMKTDAAAKGLLDDQTKAYAQQKSLDPSLLKQ